jgi:hypothetical protein
MKWRFLAGGCLAVLITLTCAVGESRGELRIYPALTVSETYNDNLFNDPNNRVSEFITRFMPSIAGTYEAARLEAVLGYTFDYRYFLKGEQSDEVVHFLDARVLATLYRQSVFLEIANELSRVSLDSARDFRDESLFLNQSDRNAFSISPYFELEPTPQTRLRGGYRFISITYSDGGVDRTNHIVFINGSRELSERTTATFGGQYIEEDNDRIDYNKKDIFTGLRYALSETLSISGSVGYAWIDFDNDVEQRDLFWDATLSKDFIHVVAFAGLGRRYTEDPEGTIFREEYYRFSLSRDWDRSRVAASATYSELYETETDDLDTRRRGGSLSLNHELTERWSALAAVNADWFDDAIERTETRRLIYSTMFTYMLTEDMTATIGYSHVDSHSPEVERDRYRTNRVMLELHTVF